VSGVNTIRMAINGVWGEYHHPVTITGVGEYWIQYFTTDFAGNIEAEKITQFTIADTIQIVQAPPVVNIVPPANPPNTPPFEARDDFPPDLHDERVYFHSPLVSPPNTLPFETADDFPPDLHDENVYFHSPQIDRTDEDIKRIPRIILDEELPFVQAVPPLNENSTLNIIETLRELDAPQIIPSATIISLVTTTTPLNGVLVTLATLGVITAGAGALTMSANAIAKKKEQEAEKAQALADLQAQQALQAQTSIANWAENQAMQAQAGQAVVIGVTQSQANKNHWAAYADWQQKVAEVEFVKDVKNFVSDVLSDVQATSFYQNLLGIASISRLAIALIMLIFTLNGSTITELYTKVISNSLPNTLCDNLFDMTDVGSQSECMGGPQPAGGRNTGSPSGNPSVTRVPNPWGTRGGPLHRNVIDARIQTLENMGYERVGGGTGWREIKIPTVGGFLSFRRPDIVMRAPDGSLYYENVGRGNLNGTPIAREVRALDDLERALGIRPVFTPYNFFFSGVGLQNGE